jgi:FGGY family of carbohydrate kinases, N-terminal domain
MQVRPIFLTRAPAVAFGSLERAFRWREFWPFRRLHLNRRGADACVPAGPADGTDLRLASQKGCAALICRKRGLPLDPMFSAAKARWLLDRLPRGQARARAGEVCIGAIDAFLLSRFGGEAVVEAGNASRTQLFDVVQAIWTRNCSRSSTCPLRPCRFDWAVSKGAGPRSFARRPPHWRCARRFAL